MVIGVGLMVWMIALGDGIHEIMIRSSLNTGLGSIQIHADGYNEDHAVEKALVDPNEILAIAENTPGAEGVSIRLNAFGLLSRGNASQGTAIIGVDPVRELGISIIDEKLVDGEWLPPVYKRDGQYATVTQGPDGEQVEYLESNRLLPIVIGSGMARKLDVEVGDRVFCTMQGFTRDVGYAAYSVHGIFTTGMSELDKTVVYVPIDLLRDVMAADMDRYSNAAHEVTILLESEVDEFSTADYLKNELANAGITDIEVMTWQQIQPGLKQFIDLDAMGIYIFMVILFIIVAAGIMNTFLMGVYERIREFGVLMSIGMRPGAIFRMVMIESAIVGFIGGFFGLIAGLIATWINTIYPFNYSAYSDIGEIFAFDWSLDLTPHLIFSNVLTAVIGIIITTLLAALWPAIKAALLKPVEALRHI